MWNPVPTASQSNIAAQSATSTPIGYVLTLTLALALTSTQPVSCPQYDPAQTLAGVETASPGRHLHSLCLPAGNVRSCRSRLCQLITRGTRLERPCAAQPTTA